MQVQGSGSGGGGGEGQRAAALACSLRRIPLSRDSVALWQVAACCSLCLQTASALMHDRVVSTSAINSFIGSQTHYIAP